MDPRTEVHVAAKDESSESEERLSPGARSFDDDVDSDKSGGNSKKRKRGSYRCSRCGMPKRGHNCPDSFEGVHFAIVDTLNGTGGTGGQQMSGNGPTSQPGFAASLAINDDTNRETLLVQVSSLREENVRLSQELFRLREMCQFQAHALHSMNPSGNPDLPRGIGNVTNIGGNNFQAPYQALPIFPPAFSPNAPGVTMPPTGSVASNFAAQPQPMPLNAQLSSQPALLPKPIDEQAPLAKRVKMDEPSSGATPYLMHPSFHHQMPMYASIHAPFPPEHLPELQQISANSRQPIAVDYAGHHDYDYDRHETWFDTDSSTSEHYPLLEVPTTLIY